MSAEYWAKLDSADRVVHVAVVTREYMDTHPKMFDGEWVQTFADVEGKTFAGLDFTYDREAEDFVAPELNPHWKELVGWVE